MANINLKDLSVKKVRCMLFETNEGDVFVEYNNLEQFKEKYENVIEVYNPTKEQRKSILEMLSSSLNVSEENVSSEINDIDFLLTLLEELTNIKLEYDLDKDKEQIQYIIDNPSDLLLRVKLEIDKICNNIFYNWYENVKELSKTPTELKEALILSKQQITEVKTEEEIKVDKEIAELEEKLKQLKGE